MNKNGPIIVIEDDKDDQEILESIFKKLPFKNEIIFFLDAEKALEFLNNETVMPFLILSDINMPKLNGLELRKKIYTDAKLHIKCIPYLFFTTSASKNAVIEAYSMSAQGFFIKENSLKELENTLNIIISYWKRCFAPNQYEESF
jgi:CheY-like chemotaxis protein